MSTNSNVGKKYRVRVLASDCRTEVETLCCSYDEAVSLFVFYVRSALELGVSILCVNIFVGKKSIKLFQNH